MHRREGDENGVMDYEENGQIAASMEVDHGVVNGVASSGSPSKGALSCEECQTSSALWGCEPCEMRLCDMCFDVLHRKGKRARHLRIPLPKDPSQVAFQGQLNATISPTSTGQCTPLGHVTHVSLLSLVLMIYP